MSVASRPALVLLVLCLLLLPWHRPPACGSPRQGGSPSPERALECPEPTLRAGEVRCGTPLVHDFHLVNHGTQPIEITDVRTTCGCLAPQLDRRQLAPGAEAVLRVEVSTLTQPAGAHTWMVRVSYKEEDRPGELALVVGAKIVSEISVLPPALTLFIQANAASPAEGPGAGAALGHAISVIDRRPRPLMITAAQPSTPHLRVRLGEPRQDPAGYWARTLQVEVAADCPPGRHDAVLRILADDATYPELNVPVTIVKRSPTEVRAAPDSVTLAGAAGEPLPAPIVLLSAPADQEVAIEHIECDNPAVQCHWAAGPGHRATLKFRIDSARMSGNVLRTEVRVHLTRPTPQTITIPVICALR
jgi:hypothetical protein